MSKNVANSLVIFFSSDRCRCTWDTWTKWGECSNAGKRTRSRKIHKKARKGGIVCKDLPGDNLSEMTEPCPVNCVWGAYGDWSKCDAEGKQNRTRQILIPVQNKHLGAIECNKDLDACETRNCEVDCKWGEWADWSKCSKDGIERRLRSIGN